MNREERRRARRAAKRGELSDIQVRQLAHAEREAREDRRRLQAAAAIERAAVEACDERQRMILHLYYGEGQSLRDVGKALGYHHSTILAERDKALEQIRLHIEGDNAA